MKPTLTDWAMVAAGITLWAMIIDNLPPNQPDEQTLALVDVHLHLEVQK